jgi:cation:H+ antiporter
MSIAAAYPSRAALSLQEHGQRSASFGTMRLLDKAVHNLWPNRKLMLASFPLLLPVVVLVISLIVLALSADRFVDGAAAIALQLRVAPMIIGMTILGFGTSAPELLVSLLAALDNAPGIAIGNALGSNITNIGLVLGFTLLLTVVHGESRTLRREFPILLGAMAGGWLLMLDNHLSHLDGLILLLGLVLFLLWMLRSARSEAHPEDKFEQEIAREVAEKRDPHSLKYHLIWTLGALLLLVASARGLVWGATEIASHYGISELVIGLTVVAIGTSLPELAASVAAAMRREQEMLIGNLIGSNLFNLLGVLGLPALLAPSVLEAGIMQRDYPVMIAMTLFFLGIVMLNSRRRMVAILQGLLLLSGFGAYLWFLYISTVVPS